MALNAQRYFGIIRIACVLACIVLAAKAVNHWIEAEYLPEQTSSRVRGPVVSPTLAPEPPNKDGTMLASRNMFCSECLPPQDDGIPVPADGDEVPLTKLPLELVATSLSTEAAQSFATVRNADSGAQGAFWIGDRLPGGGPIDKIAGTYVHFTNPESKRMEKVSLLAIAAPAKSPARGGKADTVAAISQYDDSVRKVGDHSYEVERGMIDALLANPTAVKGARMRPYQQDGVVNGFQMFAVRKDSLFSAIGLENGDAITSINGFELTTPDKMLEAYTKVKDLDRVALNVVRKGKPVTFTYQTR